MCHKDPSADAQQVDYLRRRLVQAAGVSIAALAGPRELRAMPEADAAIVTPKSRFPFFQSDPVSYRRVRMRDSFWAPRQKITRDVTVNWVTSGHDPAGGLNALESDPAGYRVQVPSHEMEHIKFIEAMATIVGLQQDSALCALIDAWAEPLMAGQGADGYLAEHWPPSRQRPRQRWGHIRASHEDYAIGHYIEAAIAYREATGNDAMYRSAIRAADNMVAELLDGDYPYTSGTPEIEQALMRLYAVTGETKYMRLCGWLLGQRGRHEWRPSYGRRCQDHMPVREQRTIEGHAVRAAFLFNGVTEYVGATGDAAYREAVLSVWHDLEHRKMYLHGASGNQSAENEGYRREPFLIPPDDTYGESCAAFGNFQWAHSLFRLTGEARYIDTAERILYNAFYASLSLRGDSSFYCNVSQTGLSHASTDEQLRYRPITRSTALATSCCPPNIVKLFNKVGGFFYSTNRDGVYVKHYGASEASIPHGSGVKITQETPYPWNGDVTIVVEPRRPEHFALHLRMPAWAISAGLMVNDRPVQVSPKKGWLAVDRRWRRGDRVQLSLPMQVQRLTMPSQFVGYENKAALMRGPIVYCLEEQDVEPMTDAGATPVEVAFNGELRLATLYIPEDTTFAVEHESQVGGLKVAALRGKLLQIRKDDSVTPVSARFVPYGVWGNRSPGAMRIWLGARKVPFIESLPHLHWLAEGTDD
jgi:uncharacterized protein